MNYTVNKIEDLKQSFINDPVTKFEFPKNISNNYLKIISNLFYLTLRKCSIQMKTLLLSGELKDIPKLSDYVKDLYMKNLGEVRERVCLFFKVEDDSLISSRTLLRVYTHYLKKDDEVRIQYQKLNEILDEIEKNMCIGIFPEEFFDNESKYKDEPKDELIDLKRLINKTVDYNSIN